jgi:hypothetical protein
MMRNKLVLLTLSLALATTAVASKGDDGWIPTPRPPVPPQPLVIYVTVTSVEYLPDGTTVTTFVKEDGQTCVLAQTDIGSLSATAALNCDWRGYPGGHN